MLLADWSTIFAMDDECEKSRMKEVANGKSRLLFKSWK